MRFPPSLLDEIRARLPVSQVVSRKVALKRAGREFKGKVPYTFCPDHESRYLGTHAQNSLKEGPRFRL
jgi:hypothetical protein